MTTTNNDRWELFSDFHKDVYGFRPSRDHRFWSLTEEEKAAEWERMGKMLEENERQERAEEQERAAKITIQLQGKDRRTAILALHQEHDTHGDGDYLCYKLGVPYGFFDLQKAEG